MQKFFGVGFLFVLQFFYFGIAFSIVRIGNSHFGSEELGFVAKLDGKYSLLETSQENMFFVRVSHKIQNPDFQTDNPSLKNNVTLQILEIDSLEDTFPALANLKRGAFEFLFQDTNNVVWEKLPARNECVVAYWNETEFGDTRLIASWGGGRGIVVFGKKSDELKTQFSKMIFNLYLKAEYCGW